MLEASVSVLLANPGASFSRIAEEAGVGRATLYRHFSSREKLLKALTLESIREIDERTAPIEHQATSARHALELIFGVVVPLGERYRFLLMESHLENDPDVRPEIERQRRELEGLIEAAKSEGSIASDVPTPWVAIAVDALIYAAWSAVNDGTVARRDAPALAFRTLLDGLSPKEAK